MGEISLRISCKTNIKNEVRPLYIYVVSFLVFRNSVYNSISSPGKTINLLEAVQAFTFSRSSSPPVVSV